MLWPIVVLGALSGFAMVAVQGRFAVPRSTLLIAAGAIVGLSAAIVLRAGLPAIRRVARRRIIDSLDRFGATPTAGLLHAVIDSCASIGANIALPELCQEFAARGSTGLILCLRPNVSPMPPGILEPFEPRSLDEADDGFDELAQQLQASPDRHGKGDMESGSSRESRRLRRNFILSGGWLMLAIFGFNWLLAAIDALQRNRATDRLALWSTLLILLFVFPKGQGLSGREQWFAVPAGVAFRKRSWFRSGWTLRVFSRESAVLCFFPCFRGRYFGTIIADTQQVQSTNLTPREADLLLRAWLSPLEPPTLEQLSDLT